MLVVVLSTRGDTVVGTILVVMIVGPTVVLEAGVVVELLVVEPVEVEDVVVLTVVLAVVEAEELELVLVATVLEAVETPARCGARVVAVTRRIVLVVVVGPTLETLSR